jgi:hypothetical protein
MATYNTVRRRVSPPAGPGFWVAVALVAASASLGAATLRPETTAIFNRYAASVEARLAREVQGQEPFLVIDQQPADRLRVARAALLRGEVVVSRGEVTEQALKEIDVPGGVINHWRGTVYVPNISLDKLLLTLQQPQQDHHKQEDVLSSRVESRDGDSMKVFLRLRRSKFVTVVYDTEYDVHYRRFAPDRAMSTSISTRIVEIENAGTPQERALPEGDDHGFMWRLNTYWRYKQSDGGVLVEIESLTLSREMPALIGPLIKPIVNHIARESMSRTLASVRARFLASGD